MVGKKKKKKGPTYHIIVVHISVQLPDIQINTDNKCILCLFLDSTFKQRIQSGE